MFLFLAIALSMAAGVLVGLMPIPIWMMLVISGVIGGGLGWGGYYLEREYGDL